MGVIGFAVLRGVFAYGQTYLGEWISQRVAYDLRNGIYDRLQRLSYAYHDQQQTGQLMSRATQDVEAVRMFIMMGVIRGAYIIVLLVASLVLMMVTNWKLALVVWAFIPFIVWRSTVMAFSLRPLWTAIQEGLARLATVLQEALSGARVVKAFAREEHEGEKFRHEAEALFADSYKSSRIQATNAPLMSGLWLVATAATLWVGGREVVAGNLEAGELTAFLLYLYILQMPVRMFGWVIMINARANAAGERIFEILDAESAVREKPGAIELAAREGARPLRGRVLRLRRDQPCPVAHRYRREAGRGRRAAGADGQRQDDRRQPDAALLRRHRRRASRSTAPTSAT